VSRNPDTLPPHYRRNFVAFLVDYVCFGIALKFFDPTSVLPAFVSHLTDSAPVVGLVGTIFRGGWVLPQLAVARLINDRPRKKPCILAGMVSRLVFWVLALVAWSGLARNPTAMLIVFFTCMALFMIGDGTSSVAWFDVVGRAIPVKQRGRLFGLGQVISGIAGVGVGALIRLILGNPRLRFPTDYALIFALTGLAFLPAFPAILALREPAPDDPGPRTSAPGRGNWLKPLVTHTAFRRLILCRILVAMIDLSTPFYVGHARDVLHLPASVIGDFVIAQTVAQIVASLTLGLVGERWGPRLATRIGAAVAVTGPLFALAAHLAGGGWLARGYPFVYVALGVVNSTWMLGFYNYLLEIAPRGMGSAYVGLSNTFVAISTLAPVAGGWLLETTSYPTLFAVAAAIVGVGFLITLGLSAPQPAMVPAPAEDRP